MEVSRNIKTISFLIDVEYVNIEYVVKYFFYINM